MVKTWHKPPTKLWWIVSDVPAIWSRSPSALLCKQERINLLLNTPQPALVVGNILHYPGNFQVKYTLNHLLLFFIELFNLINPVYCCIFPGRPPQPPKRDPRTTLSVGRARARSMVVALAEMGILLSSFLFFITRPIYFVNIIIMQIHPLRMVKMGRRFIPILRHGRLRFAHDPDQVEYPQQIWNDCQFRPQWTHRPRPCILQDSLPLGLHGSTPALPK